MTVAIVGIGYVGLPLVQAFSGIGRQVVAYDVDRVRIAELMAGHDRNATDDPHLGPMPGVTWTNEPHWLSTATDIIIAVPTPVDHDRRPNFSPMIAAAETVGAHMQRGALVVVECTVHPGATEELVEKSMYGNLTGFLILKARSPASTTIAPWVSIGSAISDAGTPWVAGSVRNLL